MFEEFYLVSRLCGKVGVNASTKAQVQLAAKLRQDIAAHLLRDRGTGTKMRRHFQSTWVLSCSYQRQSRCLQDEAAGAWHFGADRACGLCWNELTSDGHEFLNQAIKNVQVVWVCRSLATSQF